MKSEDERPTVGTVRWVITAFLVTWGCLSMVVAALATLKAIGG